MYHFPTTQDIMNIRSKLIDVAQDEYNAWNQDEDGYDEEYGSGGICHLIADKMVDIIHKELSTKDAEVFATTKTLTDVQHVNVLIALSDGVYELDLPYSRYETGGGFTWKKIPDVVFDENDITLDRLDCDLKNAYMYLEDNEALVYEGDDEEPNTYLQSVERHESEQSTFKP